MPGNITAADALNVGGNQHMIPGFLPAILQRFSTEPGSRFPTLAGVALLALPAHPSTPLRRHDRCFYLG